MFDLDLVLQMPCDRGRTGRTGKKHKKEANFDAHRRAKDAENVVNADTARDHENMPKTGTTITPGALTAHFEQLDFGRPRRSLVRCA